MTSEDQKRAFEEENRVAEALLKLSVNSSRESQRLQAIKTLWTSKLRAQGNFIAFFIQKFGDSKSLPV